MISFINWLKVNKLSVILGLMLVGLLYYHYTSTYNPPITQPVIVSPITSIKTLPNGQQAQKKVATPPSSNPIEAGFTKEYVRDTIAKILGVKEKEIKAINNVKGTYKDSLKLIKTELNEQKKVTNYYQSKDKNGNVVGNAKSTEDGTLVYKGNINLTNVIKKGNKSIPDSLIFYDPTERVTINESREFSYAIPKTPRKKIRLSPVVGIGVVAPFKFKNGKPQLQDVDVGIFGGLALSFDF